MTVIDVPRPNEVGTVNGLPARVTALTRMIDRARETVLETAAKMGAYLLERQRMITGDL